MRLNCVFVLAAALSALVTPSVPAQETGVAVYYSNYFQDRLVANGEKYDREKLTAAHKTYAFGTVVKVTNLSNGASVVVTVNDRMRRRSKALIEVSRRAAEQLDFVRQGRIRVRVEKVE